MQGGNQKWLPGLALEDELGVGAVTQDGRPAGEAVLRGIEVKKALGGKALGGTREEPVAHPAADPADRVIEDVSGDLRTCLPQRLLDGSTALLEAGRPAPTGRESPGLAGRRRDRRRRQRFAGNNRSDVVVQMAYTWPSSGSSLRTPSGWAASLGRLEEQATAARVLVTRRRTAVTLRLASTAWRRKSPPRRRSSARASGAEPPRSRPPGPRSHGRADGEEIEHPRPGVELDHLVQLRLQGAEEA